MSNRVRFWAGVIGFGVNILLFQTIAVAVSVPEMANLAKAITVKISEPNSQGSGVILQHQGDVYTVLTVAHVVKNHNVAYTIATADGKTYPIVSDSIRSAAADLDLAVVKFRAQANYPTAKIGNSHVLTEGMDLYVTGYPATTIAINKSIFVFREGKVSANSNETLAQGYSLIYSNDTLPGMSGGPVLDRDGALVAIHGRGDREQLASGELGGKTGFNLGIPIDRFATIASNLGVSLNREVVTIPQPTAPKPDDYLALGVQKNRKGDYRGALADYNRAIELKPNYAIAYNYRGLLKVEKLNDLQGALADYDRAIQIDPKLANSYNNRGLLKKSKLNDLQGALADYNLAIQIDPNYANPYNNRGLLKATKLNDPQGALADYNRAIQIDPNYARVYNSRGILKAEKLNDIQGALTDYNLAIKLDPNYANPYNSRGVLKADKLNDLQGALADYNLAIKLDPNYAIAFYSRGVLKYNFLGDRSGGMADMQRAANLFQQQSNQELYRLANNYLQKMASNKPKYFIFPKFHR